MSAKIKEKKGTFCFAFFKSIYLWANCFPIQVTFLLLFIHPWKRQAALETGLLAFLLGPIDVSLVTGVPVQRPPQHGSKCGKANEPSCDPRSLHKSQANKPTESTLSQSPNLGGGATQPKPHYPPPPPTHTHSPTSKGFNDTEFHEHALSDQCIR